jgi:hypothetical protein
MWRMIRLLFIFLLSWFLSCAGRERKNPLDPANPDTRGRVQSLSVSSERKRISLAWIALSDAVSYYRVYQRQAGQPSYELIGHTQFPHYQTDAGYGEPVLYRVSAVSQSDYESALSDSVMITPGPHDYWVADYYAELIHRISYDAAHLVYQIYDFFLPVDIVSDSTTGQTWALDWRGGDLIKITGGVVVRRVSGLRNPRLIALDPGRQTLWVVHDSLRQIVRFDTAGSQIDRLAGFGRVTDISWAGEDRGCWIVDADSEWVGLCPPTEQTIMKQYFNSPTVVDAHIAEGWAWVAAGSQLIRLYDSGASQTVCTLEGPVSALSTDYRDGSCWMIMETAGGYRVQKIDTSGELICTRDDLYHAVNILSNPVDGGCIVADFERGLVRLSAAGEIVSQFSIFYSPLGMCRG